MIHGFDTEQKNAATAALLVYATYRSRERSFKVTPDLWSQVERFVKASAKRSKTISTFLESLKPRLRCGTLQPRWLETDESEKTVTQVAHYSKDTGALLDVMEVPSENRTFLTKLLRDSDERAVLRSLYRETALIVLLVRDRLEREKPYESQLERDDVISKIVTKETV